MKTLKLKLKKDVLIVDAENGFNHFKIYDDEIGFIFIENGMPRKELIKGSYKFFCKGSELTEEIASELFEYDDFLNCFEAYIDTVPSIDKSAFKLFIKIFESKEKFWLENSIEKPINRDEFYKSEKVDSFEILLKEWQEAEEKTFKNPLIFVKK